jgi:dCTP deaminase
MLLRDATIISRVTDAAGWEPWQKLVVAPFRPAAVQPCSLDVRLTGPLRVYAGARCDTRRDNSPWWETLVPFEEDDAVGWVLQPERFYLGVTDEVIGIPEDVCGHVHGVSSRARDGITVHQTAGLLDPGWVGRATLEITVENPHTVLYRGQRIAQVAFELLDGRCATPYRGRYAGDLTATPARRSARKEGGESEHGLG